MTTNALPYHSIALNIVLFQFSKAVVYQLPLSTASDPGLRHYAGRYLQRRHRACHAAA